MARLTTPWCGGNRNKRNRHLYESVFPRVPMIGDDVSVSRIPRPSTAVAIALVWRVLPVIPVVQAPAAITHAQPPTGILLLLTT